MDANSMEEVGDKMDSSPAPHKERWNSNADSEQEHTQIIKIKRSGSVSSSGSSSRNVGRRQHLRGLMYDRLVAPLQRHWLLTIFAVAFIVTLAGGINASFGFYKRSSSVFTTYAQMRPTRVSSVAVIENLRGMVFSNLVGNPAQFATWSSGLKSKGIDPYLAAIPALAAQLAIDTNPPVYRAYVARKSSSISDYTVEDLLASDLLNTVVEGAQIALNYMNYGALTPSVVASISELRFLTDNWEPVILACRDMLKAPLNDYIVTNGSIALLLWCWFAGSLAVLLMALALVDRKLLHEFFNNQTIVVGLVQQVPRIAAADLVMQFEEAIEDFIAINGVDDGEDGLNVRGAGNVQKQLEKASLSTSRSGSSTNRQSERLESRTRQIKTRIIAGIAVIALSVASIYIFTLRTLDIASYVEYLIQSTDRRQNIITLRLVTREFFSGSSAIDPGLLVTMARGQISDTLALHNELTGPLALFMPNETRWTRDCTPTSPLYCATMVENSSIGWTRSLASVTMDTEILRFLQVATTVVDGMAAIPRPNPLDTSSALYKNWLLLLALSSDLQTRIFNAHSTLINTSQLEINANQAGTVVMFVTALVIAAAGYATLYFGVLRPLHRDAHAVITLIHHVPEPVVQKDVPKLLRFMESGGASLEVAASGEEDAAM
ncbi:hypothetical protein BC828DRAFT_77918 [Blastocladiella britannica]|nr:hypothetical protein BC828DRAFT_77918 [Blastocladiella britannica]